MATAPAPTNDEKKPCPAAAVDQPDSLILTGEDLEEWSQHDHDSGQNGIPEASPAPPATTSEYSVFSTAQRRYIVVCASWAAFFSPVSANIYLPALNTIARDLSVSNSMINLTVTSYMIFQGLAPMFWGDFADTAGRRPAILLCFAIYICANIGLALQENYVALFLLRCLQSAGSSPTIALSMGIIADIATSAQRGSYIGWATAGSLMGPALGPVIGGLLSQYLGWRSIFWFLVIFAGVFMAQFATLFPETGRNIVGNGSIPPQKWNVSVITYMKTRKSARTAPEEADTTLLSRPKLRFPNPIKSLSILLHPDAFIVLLANALMFAAFYDMTVTIPSAFADIYGYNDFQIGLCYLPIGVGATLASIASGFILDYNYRRIAKQHDIPVDRTKQQDLRHFPIEKARLQVTFPLLFLSVCVIVCFGWTLHFRKSVAAPLFLLFIGGGTLTASVNTVSALLVDLHPGKAATVTASNNLVRCLFGAGATAVLSPMTSRLGRGWCFTLIAFVMCLTVPMMLVVIRLGPKWREERYLKTQEREEARAAEPAEKV